MGIQLIEVPPPDKKTTWEDKTLGIRDNKEFKRYDTRALTTKISDTASLIFHEIFYLTKILSRHFFKWQKGLQSPKFSDSWVKQKSPGSKATALAIFFHGINGTESIWDDHQKFLKQKSDKIDTFAPRLPLNGHASIHDKETILLKKEILNWIHNHPKKPVALFGQSRGSMYAIEIEIWLRTHAPQTPVHVSLTGAVLYGTRRINDLTRWINVNRSHLFTFGFLTKTAIDELAFANKTAKALLKEARKPLKKGSARDYVMYACQLDSHVPHPGSSLPIINVNNDQPGKTQKHYFCKSGHNSIVDLVKKNQLNDFIDWTQHVIQNGN